MISLPVRPFVGVRSVQCLSGVFAALFFAACASTPVVPLTPATSAQIDERTLKLQALESYKFNGGLGILTDEQNVSARVSWAKNADDLEVVLQGPLGIGRMQLTDANGTAMVTRGGKVVAQGRSVDAVLMQGLGLAAPVPVEQLKQWVIGLPGEAESVVTDVQGKLTSLEFADAQGTRWLAEFPRYVDFDGLPVPGLITATGGPYSIRLVLRSWQQNKPAAVPQKTEPDTRLAIPSG